MDKIRSNNDLLSYVERGRRFKYLYFWGHQKSKGGITKSCFSQWYSSSFVVDGITYRTAEHYMMAGKARLFNDPEAEKMILEAATPGEAKTLGRGIKNFSDEEWKKARFDIVVEANYYKFTQNEELKMFILSTGNRVLVEASPVDKIWGIGLAADDDSVNNPRLWKGLNLLGYALMEVRDRIINE